MNDKAAPRTTRIDALDAIRGVAVLGIFIINIIGYGAGPISFSNPLAVGDGGFLDNSLWTVSTVFVEGSMRGLFSLLFGAGIILFTARAPYPDGPIKTADLYYRRTLWLLVFGFVHTYVLFGAGDILVIYAIAGLFLFPFRVLSPKNLLAIFAFLLLFLVAGDLEYELAETAKGEKAALLMEREEAGHTLTEAEEQLVDEWIEIESHTWPAASDLDAMRDERVADLETLVETNAEWSDGGGFVETAWWTLDSVVAMFLGMALFKMGVLTAEKSTRFYLVVMLVGYGLGLAFRIWAVNSRWAANFSPILWAWNGFGQPARIAVTLGHVGLFFLIWRIAVGSAVMKALVATGRMALTNYIGQTIIVNLIFSGVGLGLFGLLSFTEMYSVMLGIWVFQLLFSAWWLNNFRFGPLEWLWRSLTYWQRQPMRKS